MNKKIIGIFVCILLITTYVVPVMGELNILKKKDIKSSTSDGTTALEFMIAGKELRGFRAYWIHVPPSYDELEPVPLVIMLFGNEPFFFKDPLYYYNQISWYEDYTELSKKADDEGFIVVYPAQKLILLTGFGPYWYTGRLWPTGLAYGYDYNYEQYWSWNFIDDIGFIQELIYKMEQEYTINSSRIYVTGISDGAFMSYSIAAHLSDIVAAIAPVAGSIGTCIIKGKQFYYIPTPENPVPIIAFHGTRDIWVPYDNLSNIYDNGWRYPSVNESITFWVEHNRCDPIPEIYTSETGKTIRRTYTNGMNGTEVILYTTVDGNHWWPGNHFTTSDPDEEYLVDNFQEISATDLIWEFFEAHPKQ